MPWVNQEMCTGCQLCVKNCPASAVSMTDGVAAIDDDRCIRCGICHDVCPKDAVRHDGERIPAEIEANLAWVRQLQAHEYYAGNEKRRKQLLERLKRHFAKTQKVAAGTLERLQ